MNIGKSIGIALVKQGMKKKELAAKLDIDPTGVSKLVGKESCSKSTLDALCKAFDMKASEFIALGE